MKLRPEVQAFANLMESVLRENDHKGGWENMDPSDLIEALKDEVRELEEAVEQGWLGAENHKPPTRTEAADVANYAMMLACNEGGLMNREKS